MGAFCCVVAAGPLITKSKASNGRDSISSLSHRDEPQWHTNLSFSPPRESRDVLLQEVAAAYGPHASAISYSRSRNGCGHASDEVSGSLSENFRQPLRWASRVNSSDFGGSRSKTFGCPPSNEKQDRDGASRAAFMNLSSSVSLSESSASKEPLCPSRRSYPLVFCNPVSDLENPKSTDTKEDPSAKPQATRKTRRLSPSLFQSDRSIDEPSPDLSTSSRSEEEMVLDVVERLDEAETMIRTPGLSLGSMRQHHKCGVCGKLLSQKSPWCSYKIMRSSDMPAAGILPCCHVYHVECLDQVTPKAQTRDPPCPVCLKAVGAIEESLTVSEPLHLALRSLRRSQVAQETSASARNPENADHRSHRGNRSWQWIRIRCCLNIICSSSPHHQHEPTEH